MFLHVYYVGAFDRSARIYKKKVNLLDNNSIMYKILVWCLFAPIVTSRSTMPFSLALKAGISTMMLNLYIYSWTILFDQCSLSRVTRHTKSQKNTDRNDKWNPSNDPTCIVWLPEHASVWIMRIHHPMKEFPESTGKPPASWILRVHLECSRYIDGGHVKALM